MKVLRTRFKPNINEILIYIRKLIDLYECKTPKFINLFSDAEFS